MSLRHMPSKQIYLSSKDANLIGDNESEVFFFFKDVIHVPPDFRTFISVQNAQIPASFYNVRDINNTLDYTYNSQDFTLTISEGEYDIDTFIEDLNTQLANDSDITGVYSETTNKITFTASADFTFKSNSTLLEHMGFTAGENHTSSGQSLTSNQGVSLEGITTLLIHSNFTTQNMDARISSSSNYLVAIPVNVSFASVLTYNNDTGFRVAISDRTFNFFHLRIEDESGNLVDLNGLHWFMTLQLDFEFIGGRGPSRPTLETQEKNKKEKDN